MNIGFMDRRIIVQTQSTQVDAYGARDELVQPAHGVGCDGQQKRQRWRNGRTRNKHKPRDVARALQH